MSKRTGLAFLAVAIAVTTSVSAPRLAQRSAHAQTPTKPNILILLTDDQRPDQLDHMPKTRSLIGDAGINFTQATVVDPLCCPSRISLLRGQYSQTTGVWAVSGTQGGFGKVKRDGLDRSTLGTWLQGVGYRTAMIGKWMNGYNSPSAGYVAPGWNVWRSMTKMDSSGGGYFDYGISENGVERLYGSTAAAYSTDVLTGYARDFITSTPTGQPFFLYLAYRAPHTPSTPAPAYATDARCLDASTANAPSFNEADVSDKPMYIQKIPPFTASQIKSNGTGRPRKICRALLSVDDSVSSVLSTLQQQGSLANTFIVFMSDNGLSLGQHRRVGKKVPYEESVRVPFLVRYDPITEGSTARTSSALVQSTDLASTIAELVGFTPPIPQDGQSFLGLLDGDGTWRDQAFFEAYDPPGMNDFIPAYCGLRTASYAFYRYDPDLEPRYLELYDLAADPAELTNVAYDPAYAAVLDDLSARLRQVCSPGPPDYQWPP